MTIKFKLISLSVSAVFLLVGNPASAAGCADNSDPSRERSVEGSHYMVAAANPDAVKAGCDVLEAGGHAIDAAIAVQAALSVVEPEASGLAGGTTIMYWDQETKDVRFFEGLSKGAAAATVGLRTPFEDEIAACGTDRFTSAVEVTGRGFGVPGTLKVLNQVHEIYGKKPWKDLFTGGIELAENGFAMPPYMNTVLGEKTRGLVRCEYTDLGARYCQDGVAFPVGTTIYNPEIAQVMREVAEGGADAFYDPEGTIAPAILERVTTDICKPAHDENGPAIVSSRLTGQDFADYESAERTPVCREAFGHMICSTSPPSYGGVALHYVLEFLARGGIKDKNFGDLDYTHLFIEASRLAQWDRRENVGDPDFNPDITLAAEELLTEEYLDQRFTKFSPDKAVLDLTPGRMANASDMTSHVAIVDQSGNALSMTTTNNTTFGSQMEARGITLNNVISNFTRPDSISLGQLVNHMEPSKKPRTSITPTVVLDGDGNLRLVVGAAGGGPIPDYVLKVVLGVVLDGLNAQEAINRPNMSGQGLTGDCGGIVGARSEVEADTILGEQLASLQNDLAHPCARTSPLRSGLAAISVSDGMLYGGADPRRDGVAMGR